MRDLVIEWDIKKNYKPHQHTKINHMCNSVLYRIKKVKLFNKFGMRWKNRSYESIYESYSSRPLITGRI